MSTLLMTDSKSPTNESSLDRYIESQAGLMLSHANIRRGARIMAIVGSIMLSVALSIVAISIIAAHPPAAAGAIGPGLAGTVNLLVSRVMRSRTKPALEVNANLTPEARGFMANLMKDIYGWPQAWGAIEPNSLWNAKDGYMPRHDRVRERHVWRRMIAQGSWGQRQRSAQQVLDPAAFEVLDKAAFQYNRIAGLLGTNHPEMVRLGPTVKAAADQAMADIFHIGYLLESYPESSEAAQAQAHEQIKQLEELGDRLEAMQKQTVPDIATKSSSPLTTVLEELRLDQLARAELAQPEESKQQIDLHVGG